MVQYYTVAGRQVGSHILAMTVLGTTGFLSWLATRGGGKQQQKTPPIQASTKDEENFIQEFIKQAEAEDSKSKH